MKPLKQENHRISSILAFILIPLSGLAIDVYIPSFPQMASNLGVTADNIKLTMTIYLISYGISQLFVGILLDSFGRYKIHIWSLFIFVLSCVVIAKTSSIDVIYWMRFVQGITISFIVVAKRALFIDIFTGEKRKKYTSMVTVVWSTAPILAPFIGGYLQQYLGWRSNFIFMAIYGSIMLVLELIYSGETIPQRQKMNLSNIWKTYSTLLKTKEYSLGIIILGFSYSMVMVFGMSMPFIVEHKLHLSPVVTGYCALASGVSILLGGLLSKRMIDKSLYRKLWLANSMQIAMVLVMILSAGANIHLLLLCSLAMFLHFWQGFTYNTYFTYALTRFPEYAATSSGLASGVSYIIFSILSYLVAGSLNIDNQSSLGISYAIFVGSIAIMMLVLGRILQQNKGV